MSTPKMPRGMPPDEIDAAFDDTPSSAGAPLATPEITVRDRKHLDATFLQLDERTLDPARHYRWVRADAHNNSVVQHKLKGYRLEEKGKGVETLATPDSRGDSVIAIGDVILMSCPKEDFERRMRESYHRREGILASTTAETERMAEEKGIKLIQDADHNKERRE